MSKFVKKVMEVKGFLDTEHGTYSLLDALPTKTILPPYLRTSNIWAFYVKDFHDDYGKYIFMESGNWIIRPAPYEITTQVNFQEEENIKVDSQE